MLVTGASGFIGGHLLKEIKDRGIPFLCLARNKEALAHIARDSEILEWRTEDGVARLQELLLTRKISGVIHLASLYLASHRPEDLENLVASNVLYGTMILEAIVHQESPPWFLNIGTTWQNFNNASYNPVNLYAATKEAFEVLARYYIEANNLRFITLKLSDTFGSEDKRRKILALWKSVLKSGEALDMSGGQQIVDLSPVENVVDAILHLALLMDVGSPKVASGESFCMHTGNASSLRDLASTVENILNTKLPINWGKLPYRSREIFNAIQLNAAIPEWTPRHDIKSKIREYFED